MSAQLGLALKESGLDAIEVSNAAWLKKMREYAVTFSRFTGEVSADDVRRYAEQVHWKPHHSNAYGGIFRGTGWKAIGYTQSQHPSNHGRTIRVWRWVG